MFASSVVGLGSFNPAILSPDWLEHHKLIGGQDADAARQGKTLIVTHQVAQFETNWFALQVIENQFSLTSKGAVTTAFKDLVVGILTLLPQTPISAIGLNFMGHFKLATRDEYHKIGDVFAPKAIWLELFPKGLAGVADLTMLIQDASRDDDTTKSKDMRRISLQPSAIVKQGIYLSYNDHRDLGPDAQSALMPAERAASIVDNDWETARQEAVRVFDSLISKALSK